MHSETRRGFDHGVFVPLKVLYPAADIPVVQASLNARLRPDEHWQLGAALAPLRDQGVLILGSGFVTHNMRTIGAPGPSSGLRAFADWTAATVTQTDAAQRKEALLHWTAAPGAREAHPREEHWLPLLVCAAAAGDDAGAAAWRSWTGGFALDHYIFGGKAGRNY